MVDKYRPPTGEHPPLCPKSMTHQGLFFDILRFAMTELLFVGTGGRRTDTEAAHLKSSEARERLDRAVAALETINGTVDHVYSSTHAQDIRAMLAAYDGDTLTDIDPRLDQIRIGEFSGMPLTEVFEEELIYSMQVMNFSYRFPGGGETPEEVAARVQNFVLDAGLRYPDGRVVALTPEFVVRTFVAKHMGLNAVWACQEGVIFDPITPVRVENGKVSVSLCR